MADTVERTIELRAPAARVWTALTDGAHLSAWFGGDVEVDAHPGGQVVVRDGGRVRRAVVVDVDAGRHLAFRWLPDHRPVGFLWAPDDAPAGEGGEVSFTLTPLGPRTRLTVVETAPTHALAGAR